MHLEILSTTCFPFLVLGSWYARETHFIHVLRYNFPSTSTPSISYPNFLESSSAQQKPLDFSTCKDLCKVFSSLLVEVRSPLAVDSSSKSSSAPSSTYLYLEYRCGWPGVSDLRRARWTRSSACRRYKTIPLAEG
jgi:hypothetical protein